MGNGVTASLQGLIQVTAAFHHLRRNNPVGTGRVFHADLRRLELYPVCLGGIFITSLCNDIRDRIQTLHGDEPTPELARARILPVV
jgi:predicted metal-dependent hydrolase